MQSTDTIPEPPKLERSVSHPAVYFKNPITGRLISKGGRRHKELVRDGLLESENTVEPAVIETVIDEETTDSGSEFSEEDESNEEHDPDYDRSVSPRKSANVGPQSILHTPHSPHRFHKTPQGRPVPRSSARLRP